MIGHLLACAALFAIALAANQPLTRRPLSEDDGNWLYLAAFADRGARLHETYFTFGHFNLPMAILAASRLCGSRSPLFFKRFKQAWYAATAASVYPLALALFGSAPAAFAAGPFLILAQALPGTLFYLTYAEHFLLLPLNGALYCALAAGGGGALPALAAGLLAGLVIHFKPTGYLLAALPALALLGAPAPLAALALYALGAAAVLAAPLALLTGRGRAAEHYWLNTVSRQVGDGLRALARLLRLPAPRAAAEDGITRYVQTNLKNRATAREQFRSNMARPLGDMRLPLVLAAAGFFAAPQGSGPAAALCAAMLAAHLLAQQLQQNYYTPHFNPVWVPVALLAGQTAALAVTADGPARWAGLAALAALAWEARRLGPRLMRLMRPGGEADCGILHPVVGTIFAQAETIGREIRRRSAPGDTLLVWGDMPSIYIHADLPAFDPSYLFLYAHHGMLWQEIWILLAFNETPPTWVQFHNWKVDDGWDMARIGERTGIRYVPGATFELLDGRGTVMLGPRGLPMSFPLYRRDDGQYADALFERAGAALRAGDRPRAATLLARAHALPGASREAALRLQALAAGAHVPPGADGAPALEALFRAQALLASGQAGTAAEALAPALDDPALGARAAVLMARAQEAAGRGPAARKWYTTALRRNPYSADALAGLGAWYAGHGDAARARENLERALRYDHGHPEAAAALDALTGSDEARDILMRKCGVPGFWRAGDPSNLDAWPDEATP